MSTSTLGRRRDSAGILRVGGNPSGVCHSGDTNSFDRRLDVVNPAERVLTLSPSTICFIILAAAVALFVWNRLPVGIVAFAVTLSLWATGLVDVNQAFAGFGDPVIIFIASLFVVSEALDATGVTTWVGQQLVPHIGTSHIHLVVLTMLLAAALSAFLTPNGS